MKALILAAGRGKRLNKYTESVNKCMILVNNVPVIEHSLNNAILANVDEIIIVVGYRAEDIINRYGNNYKNKNIKYVIQPEQTGLINAIECARTAIDNDDFLLLLGDEIFVNPKHDKLVKAHATGNAFAICGVIKVKNKNLIKKTYTLIQNNKNNIVHLIEKPSKPLNNFMGTGNCVFSNEIFDYIEKTPINDVRGEKELTAMIQAAIDDGKTISSFIIGDEYINVNCKDDLFMK